MVLCMDAAGSTEEERNGAVPVSGSSGYFEDGRRQDEGVCDEVSRSKGRDYEEEDHGDSLYGVGELV